jgi:hypothetical protein
MLTRLEPAGPVHAYQTYQIVSPISTHFRDGTCDEAGCLAQRNGWRTTVDESTDLGARQAHYIRKQSGRRFTESRTETGLTAFTFEAGQRCFATHKVPLERPELYVVRGGDWRGNPRGEVRRHSGPDSWVNDFAEHQDRIARVVNG